MLPQQIYSLQNQYDDDASLHGDVTDDVDEDSDDNDEVILQYFALRKLIQIFLHTCMHCKFLKF